MQDDPTASVYSSTNHATPKEKPRTQSSFLDEYSTALFGNTRPWDKSSIASLIRPKSKPFFMTSCYSIARKPPREKHHTRDSFFRRKPKKTFTIGNQLRRRPTQKNGPLRMSTFKRSSLISPQNKKVSFNLKEKNITSLSVKKDSLRTAVADLYKRDSLMKRVSVSREEAQLKERENPFSWPNGQRNDGYFAYKKSKTVQRKEKNKKWFNFKMKRNIFLKMNTQKSSISFFFLLLFWICCDSICVLFFCLTGSFMHVFLQWEEPTNHKVESL